MIPKHNISLSDDKQDEKKRCLPIETIYPARYYFTVISYYFMWRSGKKRILSHVGHP
jgi:hypothetical protein